MITLADGTPYAGRLHPQYRPPRRHLPLIALDATLLEPEIRARVAALQAAWIRLARASYPAFMAYAMIDYEYQRPYEPQWFHEDWDAHLEAHRYSLILAPRFTGKTSFMVGKVIHHLGNHPTTRIKFIGSSDGRAKERLYQIQQQIANNPRVREVFPDLLPADDQPWNAHRIYVRRPSISKDASVEATGVLSTATGGRADVLVPDDIVDGRNALAMPALRTQIKRIWKSDWSNLLEPKTGRVWGIATLWHHDDANHMLMANPMYQTHFLAVGDDYGSLWPDRWPESELRDKERDIGTAEFSRGFRNDPKDDATQAINPAWFRFENLEQDPEFQAREAAMLWFASYDPMGALNPAQKKGRGQDYLAGVIIAVDPDSHRVYVYDAWRAHCTQHQGVERVWEDFQRCGPLFRVVIEKVGQSTLHEEVVRQHPEMRPYVETATPTINKLARLQAVTPLMEQGQVIFSHRLNPHDPVWVPGRDRLVLELEESPVSANDDGQDAFSQALYWARRYVLDRPRGSRDNSTVQLRIGGPPRPADSPYRF